ncbi:NAD(P)/FAD-dependent oxidoreductase [Rhodoferax mekongensis]|uniref:NAD(P)/FAD-dependent oxidoreductase n=1 Tax=Rhodoferax mekongensis TaxID=3068341 RepID=UPI0028BD4AAD|nr:FAD-dependent oxidoreductase [Rhodoferax sp. TBRC 17199]MDT7515985.1 FAD-dependent oxidoreductase [Rhodoferax sp. TBRC 17199]
MKIAIVGAGVVGITTAHELAEAGHAVTVFEKNGAASESSSFANGGMHCNSFTLPLSTSMFSGHRLRRFWQSSRQMSYSRWARPVNFRWLWSQCSEAEIDKVSAIQSFGQKMAFWGMEITDALISHHQWEIEQSQGQLILLSNESELNRHVARLQSLKDAGQSYRLLEREELEAHEPALHGADSVFKAIYLPGDRVMNCRQFSLLVKHAAQRNGVDFQFDTEVAALVSQGKPQVRLKNGDIQSFDHVVLCTESLPPEEILKTNFHASTARIDSYALSAAIREPLNAPRSALQDCKSGITIARIGKRLRVCGGAELNKTATKEHDKRLVNKLFRTLDHYFPGAANYPAGTQIWRGSRTFTHDGLPLIGNAGLPGVWLNLAHGANGWTLATASARLLSEQISGQFTSLPSELLSPHRFNR